MILSIGGLRHAGGQPDDKRHQWGSEEESHNCRDDCGTQENPLHGAHLTFAARAPLSPLAELAAWPYCPAAQQKGLRRAGTFASGSMKGVGVTLPDAWLHLQDEISTGLDSSTTFQIVRSLRDFVQLGSATAMIALLQPAPEVFVRALTSCPDAYPNQHMPALGSKHR